jgi:2-desacetyl-2-hydroxyethyl bacteriochlorophyllide A dehydrogenase
MKALRIAAPGSAEVCEIDQPTPGPGEVLLKVDFCGFCGGDLNAFRGTFPLQQYPCVLGHEIGGRIVELGADAPERLANGMRVTVSPYSACGVCPSCRRGRPNACRDNRTMGVRRPGAMSEFVAVACDDVIGSSKLGTRELAMVEPLSVGFHAIVRGRVTTEDTVAVFGAGMVGMGAIAAAHDRGATVIAVDVQDAKLHKAQRAGAEYGVNSATSNLHQALAELTSGDGPDVVVEAVGSPATYVAAIEEVAFTGRVVCIGYAKIPAEIETRLVVQKELDILGSRNALGDFPDVIRLLESGTFPVQELITREVEIDEAARALRWWNDHSAAVTKLLVHFSGDQNG